jgi:outer membrane biosynthesis protein TonB
MMQKIVGAGIGVVLVSVAAIGAFASQDAVSTQEVDETPTVEATGTPEATEEPTAEPTEEPTAEPTEEPTAEPTEEATQEPEETPTPEDVENGENGENGDNEEREIAGIPDHNPNFTDHDGEGDCEKGHAVIKTTPSGKQVRVPCQATKNGNPGERGAEKRGGPKKNGNGNGD